MKFLKFKDITYELATAKIGYLVNEGAHPEWFEEIIAEIDSFRESADAGEEIPLGYLLILAYRAGIHGSASKVNEE